MLNIFVLCRDNPAAAAQSLASLVPGVVLGHVGRVTMQIAQENSALRHLAEEAGCDLMIGRDLTSLFATARAARPGWWMVMRQGQVPTDGWSEEAMRHIALHRTVAIALPARGFWSITRARLARFFGQCGTHHHILVVPPGAKLANRGVELGCAGRATLLRAGFES